LNPCLVLGLDIQDEMGRHEVAFKENIDRTPTDDSGTFVIILLLLSFI
jgi:hypothetical protein